MNNFAHRKIRHLSKLDIKRCFYFIVSCGQISKRIGTSVRIAEATLKNCAKFCTDGGKSYILKRAFTSIRKKRTGFIINPNEESIRTFSLGLFK